MFVICMEYINRRLMQLNDIPGYRYHPRCKRLYHPRHKTLDLINVGFIDGSSLSSRGEGSESSHVEIPQIFYGA